MPTRSQRLHRYIPTPLQSSYWLRVGVFFFPFVVFVPHRRLKIAILLLPPKCLSVELQLSMGGNYLLLLWMLFSTWRSGVDGLLLTCSLSLSCLVFVVGFVSFSFLFCLFGVFFFHVLFWILSYICVLWLGVSVNFFSYRHIFEYTCYCLPVRLQESHKAGASYKICVRLERQAIRRKWWSCSGAQRHSGSAGKTHHSAPGCWDASLPLHQPFWSGFNWHAVTLSLLLARALLVLIFVFPKMHQRWRLAVKMTSPTNHVICSVMSVQACSRLPVLEVRRLCRFFPSPSPAYSAARAAHTLCCAAGAACRDRVPANRCRPSARWVSVISHLLFLFRFHFPIFPPISFLPVFQVINKRSLAEVEEQWRLLYSLLALPSCRFLIWSIMCRNKTFAGYRPPLFFLSLPLSLSLTRTHAEDFSKLQK